MPARKPRKARQHQVSDYKPPIPSDYDSETPYPQHQPIPHTKAEINHLVLSHHIPSLHSIVAIAPNSKVYTFCDDTGSWLNLDIEGSMFLCRLHSPSNTERHCLVVLNRKGLSNLIVESGQMVEVEITSDYFLILRFEVEGEMKTMGMFITGDEEPGATKEFLCHLVKGHWEMAMEERKEVGGEEFDVEVQERVEEGKEDRVMGRRISLSELFGRREGSEEREEYYHE